MKNTILINEIYDRLIVQGEGPSVGRLATFIRLANCNQHCVWCDTSFTWRYTDRFPHVSNIVYDPKEEIHQMTFEQIISKMLILDPPMIIISGGEPMLQAVKVHDLIGELMDRVPSLSRIEIETAGTIFNDRIADYSFVHFNVSPKLENSGNPKDLRYRPEVLKKFNASPRSIFKFVVCTEEDFDEIEWIAREVGIFDHKIFIMPEGVTGEVQEERLQALVDKIIERRWNITPRLHVMVWGNKRGV